jgi:phosphopantothenoylcysteine synthetase/decarboxylase
MAKVLLGVTGCIAAYKAADLASALIYNGHEVKIIMTEAAKRFITPLTLATMSQHPIYDDSIEWAVGPDPTVKHIELAKWCDIFVVCPATANTIAKLRWGLADNLLTSTYLALLRPWYPDGEVHRIGKKTPILICPAMNTMMWINPQTKENLRTLKGDAQILQPVEGKLACGDIGMGKLPKVPDIVKAIEEALK